MLPHDEVKAGRSSVGAVSRNGSGELAAFEVHRGLGLQCDQYQSSSLADNRRSAAPRRPSGN
jgi:hypothetical protein